MRLAFGWKNKAPADPVVAPFPLLNLGCGGHFHAAWTNVDLAPRDPRVIRHDLREPLPFSAAQFDAVYHSHVLEHLPKHEAPHFLAECHRVLRPGGIVRVVVPDLEGIARHYLQNLDAAWTGDAPAAQRHEWMTIELLDQMVRERSGGEMLRYWRQEPLPAGEFVFERMGAEVRRVRENLPPEKPGEHLAPSPEEAAAFRRRGEVHRWMYDRVSLRRLLEATGFTAVAVCGATDSRIAEFARYHLDADPDGSVRKPDSLFIEASKPQP
jgi:predicted SAM-dependent methyltransferase